MTLVLILIGSLFIGGYFLLKKRKPTITYPSKKEIKKELENSK